MSTSSGPQTTVPLSARLLPGVPLVESPLFDRSLDAMGLTDVERDIAVQLNRRGYAVLDFPDDALDARIERIKADLTPRFGTDLAGPDGLVKDNLRIQDAWRYNPDVRAVAANPAILALLEKLYGRRAFPFQTLSFPVGTQQPAHADAAHFSSQPERFMCGVWLAMEDIGADCGPLTYYPGSHAWPIVSNLMIGRRAWGTERRSAQAPYEAVWQALVETSGITPETFLPRKGQALIWAANLLHGGGLRTNPARTRWSQVTHYYFEDCIYYTPSFSDEALGRLDLRDITNAATGAVEPNRLLGEDVRPYAAPGGWTTKRKLPKWLRRKPPRDPRLPCDFDAATYLRLNPDVAAAGQDAVAHYLDYGVTEGRAYRAAQSTA